MKKNKYSTPLWVLATILAGMLSPMQSAVNGQLGHWLQDGNACAVISFASGLVVMFFIIMARKEIRQQFAAIPSLIKNRKVPLWNWFAGLCGAMVVFSEGASASALGVATFQTALISALLLSGLLCDRFGTERSGDQTEAQHALVKFAVSSVSQWATTELRASRSTGVSL